MLPVTARLSRQTGVRSADRAAPATTSNKATAQTRRSGKRLNTPPAPSAKPTDDKYSVRSATETRDGYKRLAIGRNAIAIQPRPYVSILLPRRQKNPISNVQITTARRPNKNRPSSGVRTATRSAGE